MYKTHDTCWQQTIPETAREDGTVGLRNVSSFYGLVESSNVSFQYFSIYFAAEKGSNNGEESTAIVGAEDTSLFVSNCTGGIKSLVLLFLSTCDVFYARHQIFPSRWTCCVQTSKIVMLGHWKHGKKHVQRENTLSRYMPPHYIRLADFRRNETDKRRLNCQSDKIDTRDLRTMVRRRPKFGASVFKVSLDSVSIETALSMTSILVEQATRREDERNLRGRTPGIKKKKSAVIQSHRSATMQLRICTDLGRLIRGIHQKPGFEHDSTYERVARQSWVTDLPFHERPRYVDFFSYGPTAVTTYLTIWT
ncbi:hypothetical protein EV421DRAFT_1746549 [Armillaria borealis]|uniref:Uncharacterized protein n=1 Tax=Armillaria borealis TaxID=47425 RepID=A0AA39IEF7_9AGAR|nr:hypothetical protein EV421DRAFT_1746549 [Armillaria borealis]